MKYQLTFATALIALMPFASLAECRISENSTVEVESQSVHFLSVRTVTRKVTPTLRACVVIIKFNHENTTKMSKIEEHFGPDVAETAACDRAMQKAKLGVFRQVSPELFSSKVTMRCGREVGQAKVVNDRNNLPWK